MYYNFISEVHRDTNCCIVVTAGNHDSPAHLEAPRHVLSALRTKVVGRLPDTMDEAVIYLPDAENPRLLVAALPFLRDRDLRTGEIGESGARIKEQLIQGIQRRYAEAAEEVTKRGRSDLPAIAMGHLTVSGCLTCPDSEREIHVGGLGTINPSTFGREFQYVALGHLHRPQGVTGGEHIRYSGSPLPLSFAEAGDEKEVRILDFEGPQLNGNYALTIPLARRLSRWRLKRAELEHYLMVKTPPKSELTPWVEVEVQDPHPGENIYETVREMAKDRPYEVVRVGRPRQVHSTNLMLDPNSSTDEADDLMDKPLEVFRLRLDEAGEDMTTQERETLEDAFRELLDLREQRLREEEAAPA